MPAPLATATARTAPGGGHSVDGPSQAPAALDLLVAALAVDTALAARAHLERDGDRGDLEVVVTLDEGVPPLLYRRVLLPVRLGPADARGLADALERAELTTILRPALTLRTAVEHAGESLT